METGKIGMILSNNKRESYETDIIYIECYILWACVM